MGKHQIPPLLPGELEYHVLCELAAGRSWNYQLAIGLTKRGVPTSESTAKRVVDTLIARNLVERQKLDIQRVQDSKSGLKYTRSRAYLTITDPGRQELQARKQEMVAIIDRIAESTRRATGDGQRTAEGI